MQTVDQIAFNAVSATLDVIDLATKGETFAPKGPCGDVLASSLESIIANALYEHYRTKSVEE